MQIRPTQAEVAAYSGVYEELAGSIDDYLQCYPVERLVSVELGQQPIVEFDHTTLGNEAYTEVSGPGLTDYNASILNVVFGDPQRLRLLEFSWVLNHLSSTVDNALELSGVNRDEYVAGGGDTLLSFDYAKATEAYRGFMILHDDGATSEMDLTRVSVIGNEALGPISSYSIKYDSGGAQMTGGLLTINEESIESYYNERLTPMLVFERYQWLTGEIGVPLEIVQILLGVPGDGGQAESIIENLLTKFDGTDKQNDAEMLAVYLRNLSENMIQTGPDAPVIPPDKAQELAGIFRYLNGLA